MQQHCQIDRNGQLAVSVAAMKLETREYRRLGIQKCTCLHRFRRFCHEFQAVLRATISYTILKSSKYLAGNYGYKLVRLCVSRGQLYRIQDARQNLCVGNYGRESNHFLRQCHFAFKRKFF